MKDTYTTLDAIAPPVDSTHGKATSEEVHLIVPEFSVHENPGPVPGSPDFPQYRVRPGGLLRCCLISLDQEMMRRHRDGEPLAVEGQTLPCVYHSDHTAPVVVYRDGCWQWVGSRE